MRMRILKCDNRIIRMQILTAFATTFLPLGTSTPYKYRVVSEVLDLKSHGVLSYLLNKKIEVDLLP
jgi:hypothetical protein